MRALRCIPWLLLPVLASAQVAVAYPGIDREQLTRDRVRDVFLGRISSWPDGSPIIIVLVGDATVDESLVRITGRDHVRLLRGWKRLLFSGNGSMPIVVSSTREAQELVARRPGAIAIVNEALEGLKVTVAKLDGE